MTGTELLEGMSFVDDRLVDEAENAGIRKTSGKTWMRWVSMAACVCIVAVGAFAFHRMERNSADDAAGETVITTGNDAEMAAGSDGSTHLEPTIPAADSETAPVQAPADGAVCDEQPSVVLRIDQWTEDGFVGTVERMVDTDVLPLGKQLRVYIAEDAWIQLNGQSELKDTALLPEGELIMVQFSDYDEESGTLYADVLSDAD